MNQHPFTAALAEQHRADRMASARQARDLRRAENARTRSPRLRPVRAPRPTSRPVVPVVRVADAI